MNMLFEGRFRGKLLLIVLLLCAILGAQASSLVSEQEHHHGAQHCCRLCHIGPVPILPSAVAPVVVAPFFAAVWVVPSGAPGAPREVLLAAAPSRAPPA